MEGHVNEISDLCVFNSKRMEETPRCLFYASGNELRADRKVAVVPAFTIRRDCVETQFPWNSPTPLLLPPLPSSVLTGVDARNTRRGRGRCLFSVRRHHEEELKERRSGLSSKKVLGLLDAPPSLPPSFWITASKERGTMELVSLSLFLPPLSDPCETNGVSRAVAANSRHSPNYKQYAARCVWRPTDK